MANVKLIHGNCIEVLKTLPENSIDSIVCDPPYGLEFMGEEFDSADGFRRSLNQADVDRPNVFGRTSRTSPQYRLTELFQEFTEKWATEALRVLKPGGHLLAFGGSRTYHRMATAVEDAGFEIRDQIMWLYGCLTDDTHLVTPVGQKSRHEVNVGDLILCYDPSTNSYSWGPIEEKYEYDIADTIFRIHSDHTDQLVSRNHRCLVEQDGAEVFQLADIAAREREARVPFLENLYDLLRAIPNPQPNASATEQNLHQAMQGQEYRELQPGCTTNEHEGRDDSSSVFCVPENGLEAACMVETNHDSNMLPPVQRSFARAGMEAPCSQGSGSPERGVNVADKVTNDGTHQSMVERRCDPQTGEGKLQRSSLRALSPASPCDGSEGRLHSRTPDGSGKPDRQVVTAEGGRSSRRSHPFEQCTGEPSVVCEQLRPQEIRGWSGHKTTVAAITPEHYVGRIWCVRVSTGSFVAVRKGKAFPTGNSGFPKSLNVGKAIDKRGPNQDHIAFPLFAKHYAEQRKIAGLTHAQVCELGHFYGNVNHGGSSVNWESGLCLPTVQQWEIIAPILNLSEEWKVRVVREEYEREVIGTKKVHSGLAFTSEGPTEVPVTAPGCVESQKWDGWGTALKPAHEPIVVARKPLIGTVATNVLAHGTGALNIDACRVEHVTVGDGNLALNPHLRALINGGNGGNIFPTEDERRVVTPNESGRWPANIIHDGSDEVLETFPEAKGQQGDLKETGRARPSKGRFGDMAPPVAHAARVDESTSAARCFTCAIPDSDEAVATSIPSTREGEASADRRYTENGGTSFAMLPGQRRFDAGSAARFFTCAKPDSAEAEAGATPQELGRWPANVVHDGSEEAMEEFAKSGERAAGKSCGAASVGEGSNGSVPSMRRGNLIPRTDRTAARFFYCAKPSRKERNLGLEDPGVQFQHGDTLRKIENKEKKGNTHPTVKPVSLMRWLVRLVTPPGGTVLDPFVGSGTTGMAAREEGFDFIGIDSALPWLQIAISRISASAPLIPCVIDVVVPPQEAVNELEISVSVNSEPEAA